MLLDRVKDALRSRRDYNAPNYDEDEYEGGDGDTSASEDHYRAYTSSTHARTGSRNIYFKPNPNRYDSDEELVISSEDEEDSDARKAPQPNPNKRRLFFATAGASNPLRSVAPPLRPKLPQLWDGTPMFDDFPTTPGARGDVVMSFV